MDSCTHKFPQQVSILELPHGRLQPINRDDVAVSHVGNPSISVSGGTERVESFAVRIHVRATVKASDDDMREATQGQFTPLQKLLCNKVIRKDKTGVSALELLTPGHPFADTISTSTQTIPGSILAVTRQITSRMLATPLNCLQDINNVLQLNDTNEEH